jgi:transposase
VRYEYPPGRRVNALAAYAPYGPAPWLGARPFERALTSDDLIASLKALPAADVPRVLALGNASWHVSTAARAARPARAALGIDLDYLPAYRPERNAIEAGFKQVKHPEIPPRSDTSKAELRAAVEQGFSSYGLKLRPKPCLQLRPAA